MIFVNYHRVWIVLFRELYLWEILYAKRNFYQFFFLFVSLLERLE